MNRVPCPHKPCRFVHAMPPLTVQRKPASDRYGVKQTIIKEIGSITRAIQGSPAKGYLGRFCLPLYSNL